MTPAAHELGIGPQLAHVVFYSILKKSDPEDSFVDPEDRLTFSKTERAVKQSSAARRLSGVTPPRLSFLRPISPRLSGSMVVLLFTGRPLQRRNLIEPCEAISV
jgi:hypothetical protein